MDGQRTGKRREGVLLVLWQYPRGVLMHFSWRGSQSSHERGDAALCRRPSLTWKSLSKRGLTKRGVVFQGFLSKHWAQQNTLWFCLLEGKRWVSKESKKGSKQERKQASKQDAPAAINSFSVGALSDRDAPCYPASSLPLWELELTMQTPALQPCLSLL